MNNMLLLMMMQMILLLEVMIGIDNDGDYAYDVDDVDAKYCGDGGNNEDNDVGVNEGDGVANAGGEDYDAHNVDDNDDYDGG
jgi:hypothetical protein